MPQNDQQTVAIARFPRSADLISIANSLRPLDVPSRSDGLAEGSESSRGLWFIPSISVADGFIFERGGGERGRDPGAIKMVTPLCH